MPTGEAPQRSLVWDERVRVDEEAVRQFVETEYVRVVAAVAMVAGSLALAEEAVQEALARAWERARRGREIDSLPRWVVTVALNLARTGRRRQRLERSAGWDLRAVAPAPEAAIDVGRAVTNLPLRQRQAVVLHYYLDLDVAETARTLGVSPGTVKTALHRARRTLAGRLGDQKEVSFDGQD
jgi:RNA polymerase sigma-70 factor, ECF subfamily